ncbi:C_GCAxxG_C_C family probable redox protein [Desulfacinum infernum DSM 9756]|uniref:C_GCAxxG_C_C family probable redox protein n=1 Tax=Desulfacinum infernum DSM 9756 TaxID=1121391 RepID=A0A1M5G6V1_9BACT|nr:C-GCAxxG-C-C family protein [Desulfacinum infernum]SHF99456.1 C_GCAxxG_C_C family probable redox protein [Desulfacinum infernum DSM 9756]
MSKSELRRVADELAERQWDKEVIAKRVQKLMREGIPRTIQGKLRISGRREDILERVVTRAQEYNLILKNCAQGTALALLEEFGVGNMEVIKALTHFPGIGGTGNMCGGVTGGLVALGLFLANDNLLDVETNGATMPTAQKFIAAFEDEVGFLYCADIQEVIFGVNMDPGAGEERMRAFASAKGFEKCGAPPGVGARIAAELILDSLGA